jgi:hypothetical protein
MRSDGPCHTGCHATRGTTRPSVPPDARPRAIRADSAGQVRSPFTILPQGITQFSQVAVSFERFGRFFSLPLRPEPPRPSAPSAVGEADGRAMVLSLDGCELHYGRGKGPAHELPVPRVVLHGVTVRLKAGALVGVVGAVRLQCNM